MIPIDNTKLPPGTVAVVTSEIARFSSFHLDLQALLVPRGTIMAWSQGVNIAANLNRAVLQMAGEWFWIANDDHRFHPKALMVLLTHFQVLRPAEPIDILVPAVSIRKPPFHPVVYVRSTTSPGRYAAVDWRRYPSRGPFCEVDGQPIVAGGAGMLIRRSAIDAVGMPWFEEGRTREEALGEDLFFCEKALKAGIKVWADPSVTLGHTTPMTVWPVLTPRGHWRVDLDVGEDITLRLSCTNHGIMPDEDEEPESPDAMIVRQGRPGAPAEDALDEESPADGAPAPTPIKRRLILEPANWTEALKAGKTPTLRLKVEAGVATGGDDADQDGE